MNLQYTVIDNVCDLALHKSDILDLFRVCFEKELDPSLWDWAYCNNPMGSPIVSLCYDGSRLAGHYAVIPYHLVSGVQRIPACLSMTTMVDVSYRKCGLFVEQAQQVYQRAQELGYKIVFGFPNANSTPGFRKRLGWELDDPDFVACVSMEQLASSSAFVAHVTDANLLRPDIGNEEFLRWRLSKPGQVYENRLPVILKNFNAEQDVAYLDSIPDGKHCAAPRFNILLDAAVSDLKEFAVFQYQFGYKTLDGSAANYKFKKDMILSDVF